MEGYVDPLPLYTELPEQLEGRRYIPLCSHRQLNFDHIHSLRQQQGRFLLPECHEQDCKGVQIVHMGHQNRHNLLITNHTVAYAASGLCPLETVRKSFNKARVADALRPAQLRICPHLSMASKTVARCFNRKDTVHTDINGRTAAQPGYARTCCGGSSSSNNNNNTSTNNGTSYTMYQCQECVNVGFYTAFGFRTFERAPSAAVPCAHVELQLITCVDIGRFAAADDLHWVAHSHAEQEVARWNRTWTRWQDAPARTLFWFPVRRHRHDAPCPARVVREARKRDENAAKCEEVARWKERMYGGTRRGTGLEECRGAPPNLERWRPARKGQREAIRPSRRWSWWRRGSLPLLH